LIACLLSSRCGRQSTTWPGIGRGRAARRAGGGASLRTGGGGVDDDPTELASPASTAGRAARSENTWNRSWNGWLPAGKTDDSSMLSVISLIVA